MSASAVPVSGVYPLSTQMCLKILCKTDLAGGTPALFILRGSSEFNKSEFLGCIYFTTRIGTAVLNEVAASMWASIRAPDAVDHLGNLVAIQVTVGSNWSWAMLTLSKMQKF